MPIFIPFAVGGLVLTALGLGVKRVLGEGVGPPDAPEVRQARERHAAALAALKVARLRVRDGVVAYGDRQARAKAEVLEPFRGLMSRLERWEQARREDVLSPGAREVLEVLSPEPVSRAARRCWPLWGVGSSVPPATAPLLDYLEQGWLQEDGPRVLVEGSCLFTAAAPWASQPPEGLEARVQALEAGARALARATAFLEDLRRRLEALDACVAALQARAAAQLAYLDAPSFESGGEEPRERLRRLGVLTGTLLLLLRAPVLDGEGRLAPLPPASPDAEPVAHEPVAQT
ncbi:hypothetical protein LZ198_12260 [Myxococcus sp. K15C18031901]|uniref:hypothetical protein n=1 Tax=Myxococcus dinghuensis TaxID=2906761 RepID=UPI0020A7DD21|nr:hypothetical protein [Myxococcus dinghuensis]MCP3099641.1 hypothetical protein [Myxococcus dinghuensis]